MGGFVVDGKSQVELSGVTSDTVELGRTLWYLAERGVVVSESAYARLATLYSRWHPARVVPEQDDPEVPRPRGGREGAEHIVIWAGARSADEIAVILCALEELHLPVYVVCDGGMVPTTIHRCTIAQSEPLLRAAAAIVDATEDRPGTALALARFGAPLAVARTSGAQEFLEGVTGFDGWIRDSVLDATLQALGSAPASQRPSTRLRSARDDISNGTTVRDRAPLVSVITPTYNRPELLSRALESIARQNYPAIEKIVVNDGGENVSDIAGRFAVALVDREKNGGHAAALNSGIVRARGEYVAFLDDDDVFFPDHVSSLVAALEGSHGKAAHTN
ncbi:MAG: glycosyltransferase family 2 protein, partial [Polyangiaceae bacterium]